MKRFVLAVAFAAAGCAGGANPGDDGPAGKSPEVTLSDPAKKSAAGGDAEEALARGSALEKECHFAEAEAVYLDALRLDDVPPKVRADLHVRMACRRYESGDYEGALQYARGAQKLAPDWDLADEVAARCEKRLHAESAGAEVAKRHKAKGGSVEDRLSRVEEQLEHVWKKLEGGTPKHAPEAKEKFVASEKEMQALREKLKRMHTDFETEREALLKKLHTLEEECAALRQENEKLRAGAGQK